MRVRLERGAGAATSASFSFFFVAALRERLATGGGVRDDSGDAARLVAVRLLARVGLAAGAASAVGWRARRGGMAVYVRRGWGCPTWEIEEEI